MRTAEIFISLTWNTAHISAPPSASIGMLAHEGGIRLSVSQRSSGFSATPSQKMGTVSAMLQGNCSYHRQNWRRHHGIAAPVSFCFQSRPRTQSPTPDKEIGEFYNYCENSRFAQSTWNGVHSRMPPPGPQNTSCPARAFDMAFRALHRGDGWQLEYPLWRRQGPALHLLHWQTQVAGTGNRACLQIR